MTSLEYIFGDFDLLCYEGIASFLYVHVVL